MQEQEIAPRSKGQEKMKNLLQFWVVRDKFWREEKDIWIFWLQNLEKDDLNQGVVEEEEVFL